MIAKKSPQAMEKLKKIQPYQATIGFCAFLWGIWVVIMSIRALSWLSTGMGGVVLWVTLLACAVLTVAAGALLGWGIISKRLLAKASPEVKAKAEASFVKLVAAQPKVGILAILVGAWAVVARFIFSL
ncbi:MAG: hypothetical protein FWE88_01685 [Phycisphaerae bacterium]|nr:hypothetical protein [Phycisphaerae bacterium]